jgi:hypothetical protein
VQLLPVNDHGLSTHREVKAHAEELPALQLDIKCGKRGRTNSVHGDDRTQADIEALGPDQRFGDFDLPESSMRGGAGATSFLPPFETVQDYFVPRPRWYEATEFDLRDPEDRLPVPEDHVQVSMYAPSETEAPAPKPKKRKRVLSGYESNEDAKRPKVAKPFQPTAPTSSKATATKQTTSIDFDKQPIYYQCKFEGCEHKRLDRTHFSMHWKRDAKHEGIYDMANILKCVRDKDGDVTKTPYGKTTRVRKAPSTKPKVAAASSTASSSALLSVDEAILENPPETLATKSCAKTTNSKPASTQKSTRAQKSVPAPKPASSALKARCPRPRTGSGPPLDVFQEDAAALGPAIDYVAAASQLNASKAQGDVAAHSGEVTETEKLRTRMRAPQRSKTLPGRMVPLQPRGCTVHWNVNSSKPSTKSQRLSQMTR